MYPHPPEDCVQNCKERGDIHNWHTMCIAYYILRPIFSKITLYIPTTLFFFLKDVEGFGLLMDCGN